MATPLTRVGSHDVIARRPLTIESEIDAALLETTKHLRERGLLTKSDDPGYLTNEALLHLVRDAHRRGNRLRVNALLPLWLERCTKYLKRERKEVAEAIMDELTAWLAEGNDRLDFFEVKFKKAMRFVRANARRVARNFSDSNNTGTVEEQDDAEDPSTTDTSIAFHRRSTEARAMIDELPEPLRKTATLVWVMELPRNDAAKQLGVTVRTIHNRLDNARHVIEGRMEQS